MDRRTDRQRQRDRQHQLKQIFLVVITNVILIFFVIITEIMLLLKVNLELPQLYSNKSDKVGSQESTSSQVCRW